MDDASALEIQHPNHVVVATTTITSEPQQGPTYLRVHINSKLRSRNSPSGSHATTTTVATITILTCRDALMFIGTSFADYDVALFRYGQKQPLDEIKEVIRALSTEGTINLAMRTEIHVPGKFISGRYVTSSATGLLQV